MFVVFSPETWGLVLSIYENEVKKRNIKKSHTLLMCWCSSKCGWFEGVRIHKLNIEISTVFFLHIEGYIIYITMYHIIYICTHVTSHDLVLDFLLYQIGASRCKNAKTWCQQPTKIGPQTRLARTNVTLTVDLRPESSRDRSSAQQTSREWRVVTRFWGGPRDGVIQITQISV